MKTTAYLLIEPRWNERGDQLQSIRVVRVTQSIRSTPGVVVGITLDIPDSAFDPLAHVNIEVGLGDLTVNVAVEPPADDAARPVAPRSEP